MEDDIEMCGGGVLYRRGIGGVTVLGMFCCCRYMRRCTGDRSAMSMSTGSSS